MYTYVFDTYIVVTLIYLKQQKKSHRVMKEGRHDINTCQLFTNILQSLATLYSLLWTS